MENSSEKIKTLINLMGFPEAEVLIDKEHRRISLLIEDELVNKKIPWLLPPLELLINLIIKKEGEPFNFSLDLNYYRKERERLIVELARAAAHKAMLTKQSVELPPMNAYERRLVHLEIATHPSLKTESLGQGKERHVVIKHLEE
ncbi:hypothetical protein COZ81_02035 [Candidatus Jorgensenbacteria bacterium CG_4_8_14_3_um_filter_38_10]|uniref:R3H domain-containing protein n=1 Tax=Candidatus Jorgensenbacteria bacterium CG11_big_fil_rev_8_21_14_0_20_38_23 TaxID=1974594 RepID=A0A2H0NDS6_9BACT|nr:MAG: hypothetical protein COV54_03110 [Candidatus Jorgensenbacteria bacterium CG11_big_fil_rev_8_21_14_0_20_38_23]PIV13043.1 MAG: hypothetical protein COS46_02455 [Candidatus Jorgensenbacteria bacterium CG03_land_8_20_14_0_80_38_39]PIW97514.1 MAG: hypothetical protein COZ81_02035 [Candidatus Jorgensenbacteria bacterium CG_4_8_14_3_um_filter_38_10]PJA94720.1 MAG: hypothetical protein CO130_03040 [Candidatus Jorgensenbacteria bacterium CG_4_9_14_3_um_filter_38_10]